MSHPMFLHNNDAFSDLLSALDEADKDACVEWIYSLQVISGPEGHDPHRGGGWRGAPFLGDF